MKVMEFGKENEKVAMFLHGGGLSWWNYKEVAKYLKNDFHVILPILDGHAGSDNNFISIEENAKRIVTYIDENCNGSVAFLGGLSLGGQILVEILSKRSDICQVALIESALIKPMKTTHHMVKSMLDMSYGLIKKKWFAKLQFASLKMKPELFEDYYVDTCKISKEDMIAFLEANSWYVVKEGIGEIKANVHICVGQKEQGIMICSAQALHELIPNSSLEIMKGLYHGEYSINYAKEYAEKVRELTKI